MPSPSDLKPYFFFVCVLNGNNVNECEPLGELWEIKLQIAKLVSEGWHGWDAMITRWVGTRAFIRDSHSSLISFPVIKSSEMDLSNCKFDGSIGFGKWVQPLLFPLSLFFLSCNFLWHPQDFWKGFRNYRKSKTLQWLWHLYDLQPLV